MDLTKENAKKYLILKKDLEQALGVNINFDEVNQINLKEHLKPYNAMGGFNLWDSMGLLLNCTEKQSPKDRQKDNRYYPTYRALLSAIRNGGLVKSKIIYDAPDEDPIYTEIEVDRTELEQWAKHNGYKWELPPYIPFKASASGEQSSENETEETISTLQAENKELKQRIAELEAELKTKSNSASTIVDYDDFSIYGHSSENLKILFEVSRKINEKCNPENPHSYPLKDDISSYIAKYFTDNAALGKAIYQIITPDKVKNRGRTPQGVETFKGFI